MATTLAKVGHSYDGPKFTVNDLIKAPKRVPNLVRDFVRDADISKWLLRTGPVADGGAVVYDEYVTFYSSPNQGEIVAEFGEIPMGILPTRTSIVKATTKKGLGLKISKEMETRNDVGRVQDEIRGIRNAMVRTKELAFFAAINNSSHLTVAGGAWSGSTTTIRSDIAEAMYLIASQEPTGSADEEKIGYEADTLIIHPAVESLFIDNSEVNEVFAGSPLASEQLRYTGKMPRKFMSLDVVKSWRAPLTTPIVCQRNAMGFVSSEWPLNGTPMKYDESTQSYTSYFTYRDLVAIDNPKAVAYISTTPTITEPTGA